jgi:hypothetical protein
VSTLEEALHIARLGHKVFPLKPDKSPVTAHGFKDATRDEAQVTEWWSKQDYLIGVNPEPNEVVIDLDYHKNAHLNDDLLARGFTFAAATGGQVTQSKGVHLPFRTDGRPLTVGANLEDIIGLDIRPANGYVAVWQPEAWTPSSDWAMAPDWVYTLQKHAANPAPLMSDPDQEEDEPASYFPDPITGRACRYPVLTRDAPLTTDSDIISWLGGVIASGRPSYSDPKGHEYSVPELVKVQKEAFEAGLIVATDPNDPWTDADWKRHAKSLWDKEREPREWWWPRSVTTYEEARAFSVRQFRTSVLLVSRRRQADPSTVWAFRPLDKVRESWNPASDTFTVERLLRPGYRGLLSAYESTGKTYIGLQMALCFAFPEEAGSLFGEFTVNEPLTVCYLDQEIGTGEMMRRLDALARDLNLKNIDVSEIRAVTLDDTAIRLTDKRDIERIGSQVDAAHEETGRKVVLFLDSADSLWGKKLWGDEAGGLDEAIASILAGRRAWLHVMLLLHTVKKPRDQKATYKVDLQDVLGNVTRQADVVMILDTTDSEFSLRCGVYKRPGRSQGLLQRDEDRSAWVWTKDIGVSGRDAWKIQPAVIRAIMLDAWWSVDQLSKKINVARATCRDYLEDLVRSDEVETRPHPTNSRATQYHWAPEQ